jgi:hypothetical protein
VIGSDPMVNPSLPSPRSDGQRLPSRPLRWACLLVPILAIVGISCSGSGEAVRLDTRQVPAWDLIHKVAERADRLRTLTGRGSVSVDSPEIAMTATFDVAIRRPDSLLVRLEGPFGITAGTFFLSPSSFVVYNSIQNSVLTGDPSKGTLRNILPIELTADQMMETFCGMLNVPASLGDPVEYRVDNERFLLVFAQRKGTISYWIDPEHLLVTGLRIADSTGGTLLEVQGSRLQEFEGFSLPRRIQVTMPANDRELSITYASLHPNGTPPSFAFTIPRNAHREYR